MDINKKKIVLLCTTLLLVGIMIVIVPVLTTVLGKSIGYIIAFCIYWFAFCIPISLYVCGSLRELTAIYTMRISILRKSRIAYYCLAFVPCLATLIVVFIRVVSQTTIQVLAISLVFALINALIEELFWRGVFNKMFDNKIFFAYIYPSILFGAWHIALYLARGINYQGGVASLVGGAVFMGFLWGWIAYKTKSIKEISLAHIIVNFFAFTGLIYENWYM